MTSTNKKYFNYDLMHIKRKLGNAGNTVAATNPVFDLLMTSFDL